MNIAITEEKITNVYAIGDFFTLVAGEKMYEASAVILATGVNFGKPLTEKWSF
jgi:thioredoxin reductase (NADPH)